MGFASGSVSFQRFFVNGPLAQDVDDAFIATLNQRAFGRVATLPDDTQLGWIGPRHLFETELAAEAVAYGSFVLFNLRIDKLRIPPNVLQAYVQMEEQTALEASGREFLSKSERRHARQAAVDRAESESRAGDFRRMNAYPVLLDLSHGRAYLGTASTTVADKFMQLFSDTFGASLEPAGPECVATRLLSASKNVRALENLPPTHFVDPPDDAGEPAADFSAGDLSFLGRELLTWLWYKVDSDDGPLHVRGGDDVTVMIDKSLRLKCDYNLTGTTTIAADGPDRLPEARAALRSGKQPDKMGLIVGSPLGEFRLTLDGRRFTVASLVIPENNTEDDARARIEQRFELITDAADLLDAIFETFLQRRVARTWSSEVDELRTWAAGAPKQARLHAVTA